MLPSSMTAPNLSSFLQQARSTPELRKRMHAFRESCSRVLRLVAGAADSAAPGSFPPAAAVPRQSQPEYSFLQLDAMASELLADTLNSPTSPASIPLATALLMEGSHHTRLLLATLAEAVEEAVANASALLDPISDWLAPGSSHDIALSAQSVLESIRSLIHPESPTRTLPAGMPPSSPLAMRHVQREVSVFVQCFTDFATLVYNSVHFATQGEPLEQLVRIYLPIPTLRRRRFPTPPSTALADSESLLSQTTIASDIRSLYSPFSSRPSSAAGSPRRHQQTTPTPSSVRPLRTGSLPLASAHPRTPRSATTTKAAYRLRQSPSLNDTTMGLLNELEDLIDKQEEIRQRRRTYLHNKERELIARLSDQPKTPRIQRLSDSLTERVPIPRSQASSPHSTLSRQRSATETLPRQRGANLHSPHDASSQSPAVSPRTPKAASYGGPQPSYRHQEEQANPKQQRKSAPALASGTAAVGARNPYADMPLLENNKPNRHRFTVTRVDLTDRTEKRCRLCDQGFGFLEKRVVCKDCRLTIHKDCYGSGHPERLVCECFNSPEDEEGPEPLWDGSSTSTPAVAHSPFTLMKARTWSRRNSTRRAATGAAM